MSIREMYEQDVKSGKKKQFRSIRDMWVSDNISEIAQGLSNRVNSWVQNSNSYITSHQNRFSGRKGTYEDAYVSDSADWLDSATKQKEELAKEGKSILAMLNEYGDYLDKVWVGNISRSMFEASNSHKNVVKAAQSDNDYWKSWDTAEGYGENLTGEKRYAAWQAQSKQHDDSMALDIGAAKEELDALKNQYDSYQKEYNELSARYSDTPEHAPEKQQMRTKMQYLANEVFGKLQSEIAHKETQIEDATFVQSYAEFMNLANVIDFQEKSQFESEPNINEDSGYEWPLYEAINGKEDAAEYLWGQAAEYYGPQGDPGESIMGNAILSIWGRATKSHSELAEMTEDEKKVFNYLYHTEGRERAQEFYNFLESELNNRQRISEQKEWAERAKADKVGTSLFSVAISPLKLLTYAEQVTDYVLDGRIDQNASYNKASYIPSAIRGQVSKTIENSGKWGGVGSFAYNTAMSMGDFLWSTAVSGGNQALSLAIMGSGAAADQTIAAKDRGLSDKQAFALGTIAGLAEVAMENISLGAWLDGDMTEGALKYVLKNALSEGGEEVGTNIINTLADVIIAGDKSQWKVSMDNYIAEAKANGREMSQAEAFGKVAGDQAIQIGLDFIGGALSGSVIGGGTYGVTSSVANSKFGSVAKNSAGVQELVAKALEIDPNNALAQQIQSNLTAGNKVTAIQMQELTRQMPQSAVRSMANNRLAELGETGDITAISEALTKAISGDTLSRAENKLLNSSQYAKQVAIELGLDFAEGNTGSISVQEYMDILAKYSEPETTQSPTAAISKMETVQQNVPAAENATTPPQATVDKTEAVGATTEEISVTGNRNVDSSVDNVDATAMEAKAPTTIEEAAKKYGNQAEAMVRTYNLEINENTGDKQDVAKFDKAYKMAYDFGKNGASQEYAMASEETAYLTERQREIAYNNGKVMAESNTTLNETGETVKVKAIASKEGGKMTLELEDGKNVDAGEVTFSANEALLYNAISEMDISGEDATKLLNGYDGSTTMEAYAIGIQLAYDYGRGGIAFEKIDSRAFGAALNADVKQMAYAFGKQALETEKANRYNNTTETEGVANGTGENVHLRNSTQRTDGADSGRQVRGMEEAPRGVQKRNEGSRSESSGSNSQKAARKVNAKGLGIRGGTGEENLQKVDANYSAETKKAAEMAAENGVEVVFFIGGNLFVHYKGKIVESKGLIIDGKAYIRADHNVPASKIMKHELTHPKIDNGLIDTQNVYDIMVLAYGKSKVKDIIAEYAEAYGMGDTSVEDIAQAVFVEIVCDAEAGMNYFDMEAKAGTKDFMKNVHTATQIDMSSRETRGPPVDGDVHFSREYWRPNLTQQEKATVKHIINSNNGTALTSHSNVFFEQSKGNTLFGVYSTDDSTLLYASRGQTAEKERLFVEVIKEEYNNGRITDTSAEGLYTLAKSLRMQRIANHGNGDGVVPSGRSIGNGRVHGGQYGFKASAALRSVLSNILQTETEGRTDEQKIKFSREFVRAQMTEQEAQLQKVNKALEKDNAKLQEDNQYLKQLLKLQREVSGGTKFTKSSVEAAARMLKAKADVKQNADTRELAELLNGFYEFIATSRELSWEDVMEQAQPVVDWLKANKRKDIVREELAQEAQDDHSQEMAERELLHDVYDSFWRVSTLRTVADAKQKEINALKSKHYSKMEQIKKAHKEATEQLDADYRYRMETIRQAYKARTEEKIRKVKEQNWESRRKAAAWRKEAEAIKKYRARVEKHAKALMDMLAHPSKEAHVPTALLQPLQEFLDSIDFTSQSQDSGNGATIRDLKYTSALEEVRKAIAGQRSAMSGDADGVFELDIPDSFLEEIDSHITAIKNATKGLDLTTNRVYDMGSAELADLGYMLGVINKAIRDIDKLHIAGAKARVSELGKSTLTEMKSRKPVKGEKGSIVMWANYTPWYAFRRMGTAAQQVFRGLMQGQSKLARSIDAVLKFAQKTYNAEEVKAWERDCHNITLKSGEVIQMTPAQIMSFYCLSMREQAKGHMSGGGIRISTFGKGKSEVVQKNHYLLTAEDIANINSLLTDRQRKVAQELQRYMQDVGGRLINEISMARWDYMAATEENYFPIKTDNATRNVIDPAQDRTNLWALLNKSFTKDLTKHANNALVVESIFDVFARHMSETSEYNAFALPLVDAMKWFNYRERHRIGTVNDKGKLQNINVDIYRKGSYDNAVKNNREDVTDARREETREAFLRRANESLFEVAERGTIGWGYRRHIYGQATQRAQAAGEELTKLGVPFNSNAIDAESTQIEDVGVQRAIRDTLGTAAVKYFVDLMTDINSSQKAGRYENIAGQILSRSKMASVGWNLRVAIQQPTAILRAGMLLDAPSMIKGSFRIGTKELVKEMQKYSGIALWKSMGYYDLNVARSVTEQIKGNTGVLDKVNKAGMWLPGKMDEIIWARIWAATKAAVAKEQKLSGEELLKATGERFEEVVYQTQVADSVLTRSSVMRSKRQFMREATSFMAEQTLSANILLSAFQDYESGHSSWDKVRRGMVIGFYGYALSSVANALVTAFMDAWRDDDEYETFWEKYGQALLGEKGFWDGNLFSELNPLEKIVFVKDAVSILKGYDVAPGYADLFQSASDLVTSVQKWMQGKGALTDYGVLYKALQVVGNVGGIGLSNVAREVVSLWNNTFGKLYNMPIHRYESNPRAKIRDAYTAGALMQEEAMQILLDNQVVDDEDEAYWVIREWDNGADYSRFDAIDSVVKNGGNLDETIVELLEHGYTEKEVQSHIKGAVKEWFDTDEATGDQAVSMLTVYAGMEMEDAIQRVDKWKFNRLYPQYADMSETAYGTYLQICNPAGIDVSVFYEAWKFYNETAADKDKKGNSISGSKKRKVLDYIYCLKIPVQQKRVLISCWYK